MKATKRRMSDRKNILFLFALIIILIIFFSYYFQDFILTSIENLSDYFQKNKFFGMFLFIGISSLSILLSPFTSVPLVPSAILAWGNFLTFLLLIVGWTIGSVFAYYIGSYSRKKIIKHFTSFNKIEYYKKTMSSHSQFWLVLFFRLAIPSEIASYTLGIIRYDFVKYLIITLFAELPFAFFVVYSSSALVNKKILIFISIVILGGSCFYLLYRAFRKKINNGK